MDIINNPIQFLTSMALSVPGLMIAITFHELAHGFVAYKLGDPTAKNSGRLTLNPIAHIDIIGLILLFTVHFGWAKPVPINPRYFKNRKLGMILVSIAGPTTNFLLAVITGIIIVSGLINNETALQVFKITLQYNIILGVFNLLPFPPLDGSKIVASILPTKLEIMFYKYERYFYIVLILLIITNTVDIILGPLIQYSYEALYKILILFI